MKTRTTAFTLAMLLAAALFTACGAKPAPASSAPVRAAAPSTMNIVVTNSSDYHFNELYITPTAAPDWGADLLGSTSILKKGGSVAVTLDAYDFNTYDLRVVDEDDEVYLFQRIPLNEGSEIAIGFGNEGLQADVTTDGATESFLGALDGGGDTGAGQAPAAAAAAPTVTGTGNDTNGLMEFEVYNESDYDIYALNVGVANASAEHDLDLLPAILPAHSSTTVSAVASQGDWLNTEWTMYVVDVDGDTSASFESFNPWLLSYVDIQWDNNAGGYVCTFGYD